MKTIAWREEAGTVVLVHGANDPTDAEWSEYVRSLAQHLKTSSTFQALVVTPGTAPNMRQRKELNEVFQGKSAPTAVVTGSTVGRAVVTLLGLRNPGIRAFDPTQLEDAFKHLALPAESHAKMRAIVDELRRQVGLSDLA